jgi:Lysozyme like domain
MVLTCADHGTIAKRLHWSRWTRTRATATGIVTWRAYSNHWDSTAADVTLTDPVHEAGQRILFTRLDLHVTGRTPPRFMRNLVFSEAPAAVSPVPSARAQAHSPGTGQSPRQSAALSGTLGYAQIEGYWVDAGGPSGSDGSFTYAQVAAAITACESSYEPGIIQPDQPYSTTGWGLWQITPGNSVSQYGTDFQILDPWNNAEEAVDKYDAAGGFTPWTTYVDGCYASHLQNTTADPELTDPGEYVQINSAPSGTPSSPAADPGSTYGPLMPGLTAFQANTGDLWVYTPANAGDRDTGLGMAAGTSPSITN